MHQDQRRSRSGNGGRHQRIAGQPADIVHHDGAGGEGRLRDAGFGGIDGDGNPQTRLNGLEDGQDAGQFLFVGHGIGAGPGRLPADVDQVGAGGLHPQRGGNGVGRRAKRC